ncbi:MAG: beta strand repeat-containing protein, partial [Verrucomicrobium sp.]
LNGTSAAGQSTTRVNDAAGITLNGGTIFFDTAPTAGLDYEETLGAVTLNRGSNTITADGASATAGDTSLLTITNLVRTNGTHRGVVNFNSSDANLLGTSDRNRILLTNLNGATPVAGFIGGWATVGTAASGVASDWAKYDATNGLTAFTAADYNGGGAFAETAMTAAAYHARIAPATATPVAQTAARTVGTLTFAASAAAGNVTFTQSGFDLNIASGGVLVTGTATTTAHSIAGGTLSAGSGNELLFHVIGTNSLGVASSINGTTAVIKAGAGVVTLSGINSFSGGLYLQQGTIRIANAVNGTSTSLASGNNVNVISGILAGNSTNPFILGNNITIHDSLTLGDAVGAGHNYLTGNITLTAPNEGIASIIAHTGTTTTVTGNISGGSLRIAQVAATGSVELAGNNNFGVNGRIQVDSGLLGVGSSTALGSAKIVLNGGGIFNALGYRGKITNDILVTATSSMGSGAYLEKTDLAGTVDLSGTMRSLTVNGIHQEISGRITNGGLQKEGNGVLIISGTSNDYLGGTIANDGVLWLKGNATLGANIAGNNVDVSVSAGRDAVLRMDGPQNIGSNQILSIASQTTTGMPTLVLGKGFSATTALNPLIDFNNTGTGILNVRVSNTTNDKMMLALDGWALNHDLIAEINAVAPNAQVWIGTTGANGSIAAPLSAGQGGFYRFGGGSEVNISGTNYAGTLTLEANVLSGSGGLIIGAPNATALANITTTSNAVFLKGAQTGFSGAVTFGNGGTAIIANGAAMGTGSTVNLDMGGTGNGMAAFRTSGFSGYTNVNNTYGTKNFNVLSDSRIRLDADGGGRTFAAQFGTVGINVTGGATRTFEVQDVSNSGEAQFGTWTVNYSGTGAATLAFTTASGFTRLEGGIAQNGVGVVNLNKTNAAGTLIIDGTNALTGTTSLQRGVIILTGTQGLSSGGLIFGNNAADAAALHLRNDALASSYNF